MKVFVVLTAVVVLGVVGLTARYFSGRPEPTPWSKPAVVDGAMVRLTYYGSRCRDSADVDVDESSTRVVVTVGETVRARSCDDIAILYDVEVRLDSPLGDRELVDGACRLPKYADDSECASGKPTVQPSGP